MCPQSEIYVCIYVCMCNTYITHAYISIVRLLLCSQFFPLTILFSVPFSGRQPLTWLNNAYLLASRVVFKSLLECIWRVVSGPSNLFLINTPAKSIWGGCHFWVGCWKLNWALLELSCSHSCLALMQQVAMLQKTMFQGLCPPAMKNRVPLVQPPAKKWILLTITCVRWKVKS